MLRLSMSASSIARESSERGSVPSWVYACSASRLDEEDEQWRTQLDGLADAVLGWAGNHAGISEIPHADISRLRRERPAILDELEHDAITLVGPPVRELLAGNRR